MAQLSLAASILQIVNSVSHVSASAFVQWCAALGLEPTQPQRDPEPPGFPHYDAAHSFAFKTDDRAPPRPGRRASAIPTYRPCANRFT